MNCCGPGAEAEAGTSYGVSTIYLALAVNENSQGTGTVIATEHEPIKAKQARHYWAQCEENFKQVIDLREGDLLETLKTLPDEVDLLLLDSESQNGGRRAFLIADVMPLLFPYGC